MSTTLRSRLLRGTACLLFVAGMTYACSDFLETPPQGALDEGTLANQAGVEGSLISAYRMLGAPGSLQSWGVWTWNRYSSWWKDIIHRLEE